MNRHCDIICFTLSRWDATISSPALALAIEFARHNRVFYVEHPFSWKDYAGMRNDPQIQRRKPALLKGRDIYSNPPSLPSNLTVVTPRLTIPVNFLPPGVLYNGLSKINDMIILQAIRRLIKDYQVKDFIYVNFFDPYFVRSIPADIQPLYTVYQSMDDISQVAYSNRHGSKLEEEIIRNFDFTLCTSKELTRLKSAFSPNTWFHPNAADIDIFKKQLQKYYPNRPSCKTLPNRSLVIRVVLNTGRILNC
ncbi:hypothetical protein [Paraflavitalea speifideaquila]|uniref:hypothetical protein n=1 Tax=Paraflavitalea speifideaquila TaxID=3076558 RepID=UPI0028F15EB6|nr:hypothetical protein [Paraflavitalea speifideiaquila]